MAYSDMLNWIDPISDPDIRDIWTEEALRRLEEVRLGQIETIPCDVAPAMARSLTHK
jgi:hypothetical protein